MATFTEMETDEKQRSMGNFGYNRFSSNTTVLDNQLDFASSVPTYSSPSSYNSSATYEEEATPSYEVETEYNIEKLPEDEIIVPTFMPTLDRPAPQSENSRAVKIKLNARGKIVASVFGVVVGILIAFMVYNAVVISNLNNKLAYLEVEKQTIAQSIGALSEEYEYKTSYETIDQEVMIDMPLNNPANNKVVSIAPRPEIKEASVQGNWFDSLCELLSNLFN